MTLVPSPFFSEVDIDCDGRKPYEFEVHIKYNNYFLIFVSICIVVSISYCTFFVLCDCNLII